MVDTVGLHGVFWLSSASGFISFLVALFAMPETKGLSLHEIHEIFSTKRVEETKESEAENSSNPIYTIGNQEKSP